MSRIRKDICICDLCGKRIFITEARLTLTKKTSTYTYTTEKSWGLCKRCMAKVLSMECIGDKVREEIETKIAKLQIEKHPLELLK